MNKLLISSGKAFLVLILAGALFDYLFTMIGDQHGLLGPAINLLKLIAPGVSDFMKLFLDIGYALLYGIYSNKSR